MLRVAVAVLTMFWISDAALAQWGGSSGYGRSPYYDRPCSRPTTAASSPSGAGAMTTSTGAAQWRPGFSPAARGRDRPGGAQEGRVPQQLSRR